MTTHLLPKDELLGKCRLTFQWEISNERQCNRCSPHWFTRAHYSHYLCLFSKANCRDFHHLLVAVRAVSPGLTVQNTFNPSNSHGICG